MKKNQTLPREPITGKTAKSLGRLVGPDGKLKVGEMPLDCDLADPRSQCLLFGYKDARYFAEYVAPHIAHMREVRVNSDGPVAFRATHSNSGDVTYRQRTLAHQTTGAGPLTTDVTGGSSR